MFSYWTSFNGGLFGSYKPKVSNSMTVNWDRVSKTLDFRRAVQQYDHRPYYSEPRTCRAKGPCLVCGIRTFGFDDGADDPRGPLGDRAWGILDVGHLDGFRDLPQKTQDLFPTKCLCAVCENDYERYNEGRRRLDRIARRFAKRHSIEW